VTASVEPCCLCIGAVIQSGIGALSFLWADAHAGAATCMTVDNPQARRRRLEITGPHDALARRLSGLLVFCHYLYVRPGIEHVISTFALADPDLYALARTPDVADLVTQASRSAEPLDGFRAHLDPYLAGT
jgi:hypothetical protein